MPQESPAPLTGWRARGHEVIFEAETPAGRAFDVGLILAIAISVLVVILESVEEVREEHGTLLRTADWVLTALFTLEYGLRLLCIERPSRYARSFFGLVDLFAILPSYVSVLLPGAQAMSVIRALRILRVFRVLKLGAYVRESEALLRALSASRRKIKVFLFAVLSLVVIFGSLMYLVEGPESGFDSIPRGIYWAVVTLTTVGYGDISPSTPVGQAIASVIMILGYGILAVPTGIVSAELVRSGPAPVSARACRSCGQGGHDHDAAHCKHCGHLLGPTR